MMLIVKTDAQLLEEVQRMYNRVQNQGARLKRDQIRKQGELWVMEQVLEMVRLHTQQAIGLEIPVCQDHVKTDFQEQPCQIGPVRTATYKCTKCGEVISRLNYEVLVPARPIGTCFKCNQVVYPFEAYDYDRGDVYHRTECPRRWER